MQDKPVDSGRWLFCLNQSCNPRSASQLRRIHGSTFASESITAISSRIRAGCPNAVTDRISVIGRTAYFIIASAKSESPLA
jgi:hypothetical protein